MWQKRIATIGCNKICDHTYGCFVHRVILLQEHNVKWTLLVPVHSEIYIQFFFCQAHFLSWLTIGMNKAFLFKNIFQLQFTQNHCFMHHFSTLQKNQRSNKNIIFFPTNLVYYFKILTCYLKSLKKSVKTTKKKRKKKELLSWNFELITQNCDSQITNFLVPVVETSFHSLRKLDYKEQTYADTGSTLLFLNRHCSPEVL